MCLVRGSDVSRQPSILNGVFCSFLYLSCPRLLPDPSSLSRSVQELAEGGAFHAGDASEQSISTCWPLGVGFGRLLAGSHRPTQRCTAFSGSVNHCASSRGWPMHLCASRQKGGLNRRPAVPVGPGEILLEGSSSQLLPGRPVRFAQASPGCGPVSAPRSSL